MKKSIIKATALSALVYFLCVGLAVAIDLGLFKVANMAHTPAMAALFAGGVYLSLVRKTRQFGPILVLGLMMSAFFFFSGHFVWSFVPNLLCALVAEGIAKSGDYQDRKRNILSYAIFSLGNLAPIVTMWIAPKAYAAQLLAEGKDQAYVDKVMIPASFGTVSAHLLGVVVCAVVGALIYEWVLTKKQK
ncbi:MptD family putative ECF transporter S component [Streptococcus cameli]